MKLNTGVSGTLPETLGSTLTLNIVQPLHLIYAGRILKTEKYLVIEVIRIHLFTMQLDLADRLNLKTSLYRGRTIPLSYIKHTTSHS